MAGAHLLAAGAAEVPIITTTDAGEAAVLVEEGVSGHVVEPRVETLAQAMSHVLANPQSAARCGKALSAKLGKLVPGWDTHCHGAHKIRIALVNNYLPFVYGGAEFLVDTLRDQLNARGHEAALVRIPFPATLDHKILNNIVSCRALQFEEADKVIAFKFPAYYVRHPNKTLWMFHQLRQVYELWDTEYGLSPTPGEQLHSGGRDAE